MPEDNVTLSFVFIETTNYLIGLGDNLAANFRLPGIVTDQRKRKRVIYVMISTPTRVSLFF